MSKAAGNLYISKQALSQSMNKQEKEIGGRLIQAGPEGVSLTELGPRCFPCFPVSSKNMKEHGYHAGFEAIDLGAAEPVKSLVAA